MKKLEMIANKKRNIVKNISNAVTIIVLVYLIVACSHSPRESVMLDKVSQEEQSDYELVADTVSINPTLANGIISNTQTPAGKKFIKTADVKFRVNNTQYATEKIEDITSKYGGYIIYSNLQNRNENYRKTKISRDSLLISTQISVVNNIQLKVPNENLDSFIREMNPLVTFLDYRVIKLDDVTLQYLSIKKKTDRMQNYENRQTKHINTNKAKLRDLTNAENNLLEHQNQTDELVLNSLKLNEDVNYCTVTIEIYQKSIIIRNVIPDFNYVSASKPNIFKRTGDAIVQGWWILEEIIVFLVKIWGVILLIIGFIFGANYLRIFMKKI